MYETVYHHKTVRAAEGMVALFLRRLREVAKQGELRQLNERIVQPLVKMVSGEAIGPAELLSADDFALHVLIDFVAHATGVDSVAQDLARRFISRDLFKLVPCSSARINDFLRRDEGNEQIYAVIRKVFEERRYYLIKDVSKFSMLSDRKEEWGYFVDSDHRATPMREHESIRPLWREAEESVRLFTPREVRDEVAKLIG